MMSDKRHKQPRLQLTGPRALYVAIIDQAVRDLDEDTASRADALRYFDSCLYRHHLERVGLHPSLLPVRLRDVAAMD